MSNKHLFDMDDDDDVIAYVELLGFSLYKQKTLTDELKFKHFFTVLDQYSLEELENLIPNKNETNNHKN